VGVSVGSVIVSMVSFDGSMMGSSGVSMIGSTIIFVGSAITLEVVFFGLPLGMYSQFFLF
jgi:hypothetical protein